MPVDLARAVEPHVVVRALRPEDSMLVRPGDHPETAVLDGGVVDGDPDSGQRPVARGDEELVLMPRLPRLARRLNKQHGLHALDVRPDRLLQALHDNGMEQYVVDDLRQLVGGSECTGSAATRRRPSPPAMPVPDPGSRRARPGRSVQSRRGGPLPRRELARLRAAESPARGTTHRTCLISQIGPKARRATWSRSKLLAFGWRRPALPARSCRSRCSGTGCPPAITVCRARSGRGSAPVTPDWIR